MNWPARIAILHLDSLCSLPALDCLFGSLGDRIGLVVSSDCFAGQGGFWHQLTRTVARSGPHLTLALGFDIVAVRLAAAVAPALRPLGRAAALRTLREHASAVGARYLVAADINGPIVLEELQRFQPDLVVSVHFDQILQPAFLQAAQAPVVNVHPALLPAHRGPCPAFWTLAAGQRETGVTVHRILDASIDTGPPVANRTVTLPPRLSMLEVDERLFMEGVDTLLRWIGADLPLVEGQRPSDAGVYESLPPHATVAAARRCGVRLWRFRHATRLIAALFGWRRS